MIRDLPYLGLTYREACDARGWIDELSHSTGDGPMDCREWMGGRNSAGYGVVQFRGKRYAAHRLWWLLFKSEIPDGLVVCHHCDNPGCVRSEHLFLGTTQDNQWDAIRKGRSIRGERAAKAKLKERNVIALRRMARIFRVPAFMVANTYAGRLGVSPTTLLQALNGTNWAYLSVPPVGRRCAP